MALTSKLVPYDPIWKSQFESEQLALSQALNLDAQNIHHVGSTSIQGLVAKPEIDILVVVNLNADIGQLSLGIESQGYDVRGEEPGKPGHWYFSKNKNNKRTHKLHLCLDDHICVQDQILFRDFLRNNPNVAHQYGELKLRLEGENTEGIIQYINQKTPFIQQTITQAKTLGYLCGY